MKNLFLLFIPIILWACAKKEDQNTWTPPKIHFSRTDGEKNVLVPMNESLRLSDKIYFTSSNTSEGMDQEIKELSSNVSCKKESEIFDLRKKISKTEIQLKEIIPARAFLKDLSQNIPCHISITLKNNSGSTKTYNLQERNITAAHEKKEWFIKETINYKEFQLTEILDLNQNDRLDLVCDLFQSTILLNNNRSINFSELTSQNGEKFIDLDAKKYKPHQICRIVHSSQRVTRWTEPFEIQFQKLSPRMKNEIKNPELYRKYQSIGLLWYILKFENPHPFAISFALDKNELMMPFKDSKNGSLRRSKVRSVFSKSEYTFEKNNLIIIHLLPGQKVEVAAGSPAPLDLANRGDIPVFDESMFPFFHLEYNYRTTEEIDAASGIGTLDRIYSN